jgi:hypothetical protein
MKISLGNGTIRVRDRDDTVVDVDVCDLGEPPAESPSLDDDGVRIDQTTAVRTTRLRLPPVVVKSPDGGVRSTDSDLDDVRLDTVRLRVDAPIRVHLAADCPATLRRTGDAAVIDLDRRAAVTLGFESRVGMPSETVVVPRTPDGVATALSMLSVANEYTSPDRSWPTAREQPPRIEWGDKTHVPESVRHQRSETEIVVTVPPHLDYLVTVAPLVHYLGATVVVESGVEPFVDLDGRSEPLGTLPEFEARVAALLRRTFYLDCLARAGGPHGGDLSVAHVADELELDVGALYDASLADRVCRYIDVEFDTVADEFPDWHLTIHLAPTYETARTLSYIVGDLPQIVLPSGEEVTEGELAATPSRLSRGDDDRRRRIRPTATVSSRWTGWLSDGQPLWDFEAMTAGFHHRDRYGTVSDSSVSLILADHKMRRETQTAANVYEQRASDLGIDLNVVKSPTVDQLAQEFETTHSLVHFVGHCTDDGLECWGGTLSMDSIDQSRAETFVLNACGSYSAGKTLVDRGSVAGVVTDASVLDESATSVGIAFSRLVMQGWSVGAACSLAAERATSPASYLSVGDGSHVVTQSDALVPPTTRVQTADSGWTVSLTHDAMRLAGAVTQGSFDDEFRLVGQSATHHLDDEELHQLLDSLESPVLVENDLRWPESRGWI